MTTDRRMFLRGTGGAVLAIPCLTSLLSRKARAAYTPPKRFVAMSADHGVVESAWYPEGYKQRQRPPGQAFYERSLVSSPGSISPIIGPAFDRFKAKLLLIRGLDSAVYGPQAGHMRSYSLCGTYLNGQHPGPSIDFVLSKSAKVRLPGTTVPHVSCGLYGENHSFFLQGTTMREPFKYTDPKQLFDYLFEGFAAPASNGAELVVRRRTSLINAVMEHYRSLSRSPKLGTDDGRVLEEFVTGFSSVEQRLKGQKPVVGCQASSPSFGAFVRGDSSQYERIIGETLDTLSLALKCGIVQVAHFGFPTPEDSRPLPASNYAVFRNLDTATVKFTLPIHDYSHGAGNAREVNPIFQAWLARLAARFLTSLDVQESAESPATFLDNSFVLYHNNLSNGSTHLRYDLPTLAAGSLGGRFITGRYLDFTQDIPHTIQNHSGKLVGVDYNRWLVTILQGFGLTEADYQQPGQPPGFGSDGRHRNLHTALDTSKRRQPLPGILRDPPG